MTESNRISISSEGIAELGTRLGEIDNYLRIKARSHTSEDIVTYGFPSAVGSQAFGRILGDYERERVSLSKKLRELRRLANDAGGVYVETEDLIDQRNRGVL